MTTSPYVFRGTDAANAEEWIKNAKELLAFADELSRLMTSKERMPALAGPGVDATATALDFINWPHRYHGTFNIDPQAEETDENIIAARRRCGSYNATTKVLPPYGIQVPSRWVGHIVSRSLWKQLPCLQDILVCSWRADLVNFRAFFGKALASFGNALYVVIPVMTDIAGQDDVETGEKRVFSLFVACEMYYPECRVWLVHATPEEILKAPGYQYWRQTWDFDGKLYRDAIVEVTPAVIANVQHKLGADCTPVWHPFDIISRLNIVSTSVGVHGASDVLGKHRNDDYIAYQRVEPTYESEVLG